MSQLINFIKKRGVKTGLSQQGNTVKMAAAIVAPLIVVWFAGQLFVPPAYTQIASAVEFIGWIAYILMLYSKVKADAAGYMPFPQSHWFFPDGQQISFDIIVPPAPDGYKQIGPKEGYSDGSHLYRVNFKDKIEVENQDRPYPDVFSKALWKLPAEWTEAFKRTGHGEFFFENLFVDHPACENIEVSVIGWEEKNSTRIPICLITGCSYIYTQAIESKGKEFPNNGTITEADKNLSVIADLNHKVMELTQRNLFVEGELEQYAKESPEDQIELSDMRIEAFLRRHKTIMNAGKKSWLTRLINGKTLGIILLVIAATLIIMHFTAGWP